MRTPSLARIAGRACLVLAALATSAAFAGTGSETGLPLPRFVSLRASEVNLRTGPNVRYPVEWVFQRRGLPVEIVAEFDTWRKVRDIQGSEGWVHQSMLAGRRTALVVGETRPLRRRPEEDAPVVARLEAGVIGHLGGCRPQWCRLEAGGIEGWIRRAHIWGVGEDEALE